MSVSSIAPVAVVDGITLHVTSRDTPLYDAVKAYHADYLVPTFAANEVEDVDLWVTRLQDQSRAGPLSPETFSVAQPEVTGGCEFAVALLIRDADGKVMGGASHEVYFASRCTLISYMVVSDELRGKGAARLLVDAVFKNSDHVLAAIGQSPLAAVVIEVLQVRDDHDDEKDGEGHHAPSSGKVFRSSDRQVIFKRLGFQAADLDFVHPGKLKGHRYNIGLSSRTFDIEGTGVFPASVLLSFVHGLVMGILADEGVTDDTEMIQWREALTGETVPVGPQYWR